MPALTARAFRPLVSGLRALGHDPVPLLAAVGVDFAVLDNADARIPMAAGVGLLARAAGTLGDDCIGLHLAEHADLRTVDVHYYAMTASSSLRAAYERLSRYQRLIHETTRIDMAETDEGLTLRHVLPGGVAAPRQTAEFLLTAWIRTGRLVTATDWRPVEVRFAHPRPSDTSEHARLFKARAHFDAGENAVIVATSVLALPCVGADPVLASLMDHHAGEQMRRASASGQPFPDRVRDVLAYQLREGEPRAATTARRLKMSVRTLNRALAGEGLTYRRLLDQLRHDLAREYLRDQRTSVGEVAFRLGFSEVSAFSRAYKRWSGETPIQTRARVTATNAVRPGPSPER